MLSPNQTQSLLVLACVLLTAMTSGVVSAQQDAQFTQFDNDKLTFSPAYAGAKGYPAVSALARRQWVGLEGAPASHALRFHTPIAQTRLGLGLRVHDDVVGPTRSSGAGLGIAYHLPVGTYTSLSLGLDASATHYRVDWTVLRGSDSGSGATAPDGDGTAARLLGNVGAGAMLYSDRFYVGLSAPRLLRNTLTDALEGIGAPGREALHLYAMAGYDARLGVDYRLRPNLLVKYVVNAPLSVDLNALVVWRERLGAGLGFRTGSADYTRAGGESFSVHMRVMPDERLTIGGAYDYTLTRLGDYSSGTFELLAAYTLVMDRNKIQTPRYF